MNASAPEPRSPPPERVCDEEWEIRTGRAIYILERTLPDFFETGLVSSLDQATKEPSPSAQKLWSLASPTDTWHTIKEKLSSTSKSKEDCDEVPTIYSSRIRLTYTPPTPLPTPFPKTLRVEGLHLYIASSIFVRHTLNALYTDLVVNITRVRVNNGGVPINGGLISSSSQSKKSREKSITFGLMVTGIGRVSGARAEWEVNCTYTFSPLTGLIIHHSVDSIEPAPHQALFEALGKFGLLDGGMGPKAGGVGS
ncbi:hypothetical protein BDY19DRAFT_987277 [Irpex rosettiformis]|uniref:Uncharacterized protein n=1 Tax=Irpex rosettiformis TaxID=378272 RepID=A0ACB8TSP1_9APHY|nr:hypothetical protein BDY19DRAFT_987277 [Irpex rosettiformis]